MSKIYLLRHAESDHSQGLPDNERPLTENGKAAALRVALELKRRRVGLDLILSSPALRAKQTAEIVSKTLLCPEVDTCGSLSSGRDTWLALKDERCQALGGAGNILLVGHAPDLGRLLGALTGKGEIPLAPGEIACVEVATIWPPADGKLLWAYSPRGNPVLEIPDPELESTGAS